MTRSKPADPFVPQGGHLVRARMTTGSMFPLVPEGTQLVFQRAAAYRPGDLVVFRREQDWVCHRVVSVKGEQVQTWGDWSRAPDQPRAAADLGGRCLFLVRKGLVLDLDWPVFRWGNRAAARLLPLLKRVVLRRHKGSVGVGDGGS